MLRIWHITGQIEHFEGTLCSEYSVLHEIDGPHTPLPESLFWLESPLGEQRWGKEGLAAAHTELDRLVWLIRVACEADTHR